MCIFPSTASNNLIRIQWFGPDAIMSYSLEWICVQTILKYLRPGHTLKTLQCLSGEHTDLFKCHLPMPASQN